MTRIVLAGQTSRLNSLIGVRYSYEASAIRTFKREKIFIN